MTFIKTHHRILAVLIAILSFVTALLYNEINLAFLATHKPPLHKTEPIYGWIKTDDDAAYLRPAENYYNHHEWKDNNPGRQSYFLRTPGYGLFRYALMLMMGIDASYHIFRYLQVLAFAFSVFLLYRATLLAGLSEVAAVTVESIYGLTPFAIGFLYYSITEGITPAFMIVYCFLLLLAYRRSGSFFFILASIVMAFIILTRPVLGMFAVALPVMIWWVLSDRESWRRLLFIGLNCLIVITPIAMWSYRSHRIAGHEANIYPIYFPENNSQFRPTHGAIWEFAKSYGTEGKAFHEVMTPLWKATISGDTSDIHIDSILMATPAFVMLSIGEPKLRASYQRYRQSMIYQRNMYPRGTAMPDTIPSIEQEVIKEFTSYTAIINSDHWLYCHVLVPLKLFKALSFHSNLSLYMFQHDLRGKWWMETMRGVFLILHFLCCLSFLYILFFARNRVFRLILGLLIGTYFFYLCYFFRGLEERYTLPVLPLMLVGFAYSIDDFRRRLTQRS